MGGLRVAYVRTTGDAMTVTSSWIVEHGWSRPLGTPSPNVRPRIEAAPSLRGKPPEAGTKVARDSADPLGACKRFLAAQRKRSR
jgi:hypothetical protein